MPFPIQALPVGVYLGAELEPLDRLMSEKIDQTAAHILQPYRLSIVLATRPFLITLAPNLQAGAYPDIVPYPASQLVADSVPTEEKSPEAGMIINLSPKDDLPIPGSFVSCLCRAYVRMWAEQA